MALLALRDRRLSTRSAILAVLFVVFTAGCLGGGPDASVQTTTPTATSTTSSPAGVTDHCPPTATPTASQTPAAETSQTGTPTATVPESNSPTPTTETSQTGTPTATVPGFNSPTPTTETSQTGTPTATVSGFTYGPDRETPVILYNSRTEQVTMRVHVSCAATSETVHDTNYTLQYGSRREAFDLTTVTPEGAGSSVTVAVSVGTTTESVTLTTTDCGDVTARVADDGTLRVDTSAC